MGSKSSKATNNLFDAIRSDNFERAMFLVTDNLDCRDFNGRTPLIATCRAKHSLENKKERINFVKFLLDIGCDFRKCDIYGYTALMYAEENGHTDIVNVLMRKELKLSLIERRKDPSFTIRLSEEETEPDQKAVVMFDKRQSFSIWNHSF